MIPSEKRLLKEVLRGVSRSFYLTLRALPADLRRPVGLAYLLARAADTIADTRIVAPQSRLGHLRRFREQVEGPSDAETLREIGAAAGGRAPPPERELLASLPLAFAMLEREPEPDRGMTRRVVMALTLGMEFDLTTFPAEESGEMASLPDYAALDRYVYMVAGCVGEFWTRIAMTHTPALGRWDAAGMIETGVRFGKALQLVNVLRDVPGDLRLGRCYLPEEWLSALGLTPPELLDPAAGAQARPALLAGLEKALEHFAAAEEYALAIPGRCVRLRLAVMWPLLIGLATLALLARNDGWLDPQRPSRVSRGWIYRMMLKSAVCAPSDTLLRRWIAGLRRRVWAGMDRRAG